MNPSDNGSDDENETHTTFYRELLEEAEFSEDDKPPRWLGGIWTLVICLGGWVGIWILVRSCYGE